MTTRNDSSNVGSTAFESNRKETIYHLHLEQDSKMKLAEVEGIEHTDCCTMCGDRAVWYTAETKAGAGSALNEERITRYWCNNCISQPFIDLWKSWPWTPDETLERPTARSTSDNECSEGGLLTQQNVPEIVHHLDHHSNSSPVDSVLTHFGVNRNEAVCCECDQRADWYHAEIHDSLRAYDFEAARENSLLCDDCIAPAIVDVWESWPWTPDGKLSQ